MEIKTSGKKKKYNSGLQRDDDSCKPRFDLIIPTSQEYENTLLYKWAIHIKEGGLRYGNRNWEKANSVEELERFKASAWRHFIAIMNNKIDEDHFGALLFNLNAIVYLMDKLNVNINGGKNDN